jgi:hypothetical protein
MSSVNITTALGYLASTEMRREFIGALGYCHRIMEDAEVGADDGFVVETIDNALYISGISEKRKVNGLIHLPSQGC